MIRSATMRAAAAALCAALAAFGLAACQAQEPSPEPGREEAPAIDFAPEGDTLAPEPADAAEAVEGQDAGAGQEWTTIPKGYDPGADEWPGASLGFVGPNGEGALDPERFEGDEGEYMAQLADAFGEAGSFDPTDYEEVDEGDGWVRYEGVVNLYFEPHTGEYRARQIIEEAGGRVQQESFAVTSADWPVNVIAVFPAGTDVYSVSDVLAALPEVQSAAPYRERPSENALLAQSVAGSAELDAGSIDGANSPLAIAAAPMWAAWGLLARRAAGSPLRRAERKA